MFDRVWLLFLWADESLGKPWAILRLAEIPHRFLWDSDVGQPKDHQQSCDHIWSPAHLQCQGGVSIFLTAVNCLGIQDQDTTLHSNPSSSPSPSQGTVYINGDTQIVTSDFTTADGVIHYIDKVLTPYELKDKPSLSAKVQVHPSWPYQQQSVSDLVK